MANRHWSRAHLEEWRAVVDRAQSGAVDEIRYASSDRAGSTEYRGRAYGLEERIAGDHVVPVSVDHLDRDHRPIARRPLRRELNGRRCVRELDASDREREARQVIERQGIAGRFNGLLSIDHGNVRRERAVNGRNNRVDRTIVWFATGHERRDRQRPAIAHLLCRRGHSGCPTDTAGANCASVARHHRARVEQPPSTEPTRVRIESRLTRRLRPGPTPPHKPFGRESRGAGACQ